MTLSCIVMLWETLPTSWISRQTFQLATEYYIRSITQPPPSLRPGADGERAVSHTGSWWGGGSSTHRRSFFKITEGSYYTFSPPFPCLHRSRARVVRCTSSVLGFFLFSFLKFVLAGLFSVFWYWRLEGRMCRIIGSSSFSL